MPTFDVLSSDLAVSRGTVQNSIKFLRDNKAIEIKSKGHLGSIIVKKNDKILFSFLGIDHLTGAMSLPYSKVYEGLSTGLIKELNKFDGITVNMAYMLGAIERIDMLVKDKLDFVLACKGSYITAAIENKPILEVIDFGPKTYLSANVLIFADANAKKIEAGMKVGVSKGHSNQKRIAEEFCEGIDVEIVEFPYNEILDKIASKEIDATIWNRDTLNESLMHFNIVSIENDSANNTSAVLVIHNTRKELVDFFKNNVSIDNVKKIQRRVIEGKIIPRY